MRIWSQLENSRNIGMNKKYNTKNKVIQNYEVTNMVQKKDGRSRKII